MARKRTIYPIHMAPTEAFMSTLEKQKDPVHIVEGLEFIQWMKNRFKARWMWGQMGKPLRMEMNLGRDETTLQEIEDRVLKALKPDGKL
jgi:hypothetical protein